MIHPHPHTHTCAQTARRHMGHYGPERESKQVNCSRQEEERKRMTTIGATGLSICGHPIFASPILAAALLPFSRHQASSPEHVGLSFPSWSAWNRVRLLTWGSQLHEP